MAQALRRGWRIAQESEVFVGRSSSSLRQLSRPMSWDSALLRYCRYRGAGSAGLIFAARDIPAVGRYDVAHGGSRSRRILWIRNAHVRPSPTVRRPAHHPPADRQTSSDRCPCAGGVLRDGSRHLSTSSSRMVEGTREPARRILVQRTHRRHAFALDAAETGVAKIREQMRVSGPTFAAGVPLLALEAIAQELFPTVCATRTSPSASACNDSGGAGTQRFVERPCTSWSIWTNSTSRDLRDQAWISRSLSGAGMGGLRLVCAFAGTVVGRSCHVWMRSSRTAGRPYKPLPELGIARDGSRLITPEFPSSPPTAHSMPRAISSLRTSGPVLAFGSQSTVDLGHRVGSATRP